MLQPYGAMPKRAILQDLVASGVRALHATMLHWDRETQRLIRQVLLLEVKLADLASDYEKACKALSEQEADMLANANDWHYDQRLEISNTYSDDGPGVQFALGREVVFVPVDAREHVLATGRYWMSRNCRSRNYDDRTLLIEDAHYFLAGTGMAFPVEVREELKSRLRAITADILIS